MICHLCKEDKLSEEFPFDPLTENCDHPLLHCLECATESVKNHRKCSQCDNKVNEDNEIYQEYLETLGFLFPNVEEEEDAGVDDNLVSMASASSSSHINITTLSGECATLSYDPNKTILNLKKEIEKELKTPCDKQRLLYQNTELKTTKQYSELSKLKDYNVPPNSTLYLIILLYEVPDELDNVIFDLYWGFPTTYSAGSRGDFLDASVLLYSGTAYLDVINFKHSSSYCCRYAVNHSGHAQMDYARRLGHQKISVSIKSLPDEIDNLFFTLSAYRSPNISKYRTPSVNFFDAKFPDKQLCSDEMSCAAYSTAIIMCSLSKKNGMWRTVSLKIPSSGNVNNYSSLKREIVRLITNMGYT